MSELRSKAIGVAGKFLAHRGYEVIETDWKSERGSAVDIVVNKDDIVIFVDIVSKKRDTRNMSEDNKKITMPDVCSDSSDSLSGLYSADSYVE